MLKTLVRNINNNACVFDFANSFTSDTINAINSSVAVDSFAHFSVCVSAAESQP